MEFKRIFLIVIDSVGIGECPDSKKFNDEGADTISHIALYNNGIKLPVMESLGYGKIHDILGVKKDIKTCGYYTKMQEASNGKDTMTGHWEMMGIKTLTPFKTFTETGFPDDLIKELEKRTDRKVIGNYSASGTKIIEDLGKIQEDTGSIIVYTSADSVLQIAGNTSVIPLDELYKICGIARELTLKDEWKVGRVIARPYIKLDDGTYKRTTDRKDFALTPPNKTALNYLQNNGYNVLAVGKISDIFNNYGIDSGCHIDSNVDGMNKTIDIIKNKDFTGLCFVNLVDFDSLYGHRRDPVGYKNSLEEFDVKLGELIKELKEDDLLMVTADHGNDPTFKGTDHTREYVPLLIYSNKLKESNSLDIRQTFSDLGKTILDNFKIKNDFIGESFLNELK